MDNVQGITSTWREIIPLRAATMSSREDRKLRVSLLFGDDTRVRRYDGTDCICKSEPGCNASVIIRMLITIEKCSAHTRSKHLRARAHSVVPNFGTPVSPGTSATVRPFRGGTVRSFATDRPNESRNAISYYSHSYLFLVRAYSDSSRLTSSQRLSAVI